MVLIYVLLALAAERLIDKPGYCHTEFYYGRYMRWVQAKNWLGANTKTWQLLAICFFPALMVWLFLATIQIGLVHFVLTVFVLFVSIGCAELRASFKCYLAAAERKDLQACDMYTRELGLPSYDARTFGQHLIWLNYQRYAAPVMMFVIFGLPGVVAYSMLRILNHFAQENDYAYQQLISKLVLVIDWLPIRITAFGFLIVGHFSRALPIWLGLLFDKHTKAKDVLAQVAVAAEDVPVAIDEPAQEAITLVRLAKRNIMFLLALIAVLTVAGLVR